MFSVDALVSMGEKLRVALDADKLSIVAQSGDAGRTAAHRWIENNTADVAVSLHDEFHEGFRLLRFVESRFRIVVAKDRRRVAGRGHVNLAYAQAGVLVESARVVRSNSAKFIGGRAHGIVRHGAKPSRCENQDIFVLAQRTLVAMDVVGLRRLLPNQGVAKHVACRADQIRREGLYGVTGDNAGRLDDATKLRPQRSHVDRLVPRQGRDVVGQVRANQIDTGSGEIAHCRQAVVMQQFEQVVGGNGGAGCGFFHAQLVSRLWRWQVFLILLSGRYMVDIHRYNSLITRTKSRLDFCEKLVPFFRKCGKAHLRKMEEPSYAKVAAWLQNKGVPNARALEDRETVTRWHGKTVGEYLNVDKNIRKSLLDNWSIPEQFYDNDPATLTKKHRERDKLMIRADKVAEALRDALYQTGRGSS